MKLTPQQKQITDMLADGQWHCPTVELYMKDDRKRISELRSKGFVFDESGKVCNIKEHNHHSAVKLRKLISWPEEVMTPFFDKSVKKTFCCLENWKGGEHNPKCFKLKMLSQINFN